MEENQKIHIISLDFEENKKIEKIIKKTKEEIIAIALIDETIVENIAEIFSERGWLGVGQLDTIKEVARKKALRKSNEWVKYIQTIANKINIPIQTVVLKQHLKEYLEEIRKTHPKKIIFSFKKGLNPTYDNSKYLIREQCKKLRINYEIMR